MTELRATNDTKIFDKRQTNIAKGVAVLLLLWHHLFLESPQPFISLWSKSVPIEYTLALFCKICVAIFLFVSGLGLQKSWEKKQHVSSKMCGISFSFVKKHLLKLLMNYWFIYISFVPLGIFFGRNFWAIYEANPIFAILDFSGLSYLFNTPTMNVTWWFMSLIIVLYIAFPFINKLLRRFPELVVLVSLAIAVLPKISSIPFIGKLLVWVPPFVMGMFFAEIRGFERLQKGKNLITQIAIGVVCLVLSVMARLRIGNYTRFDAVFALLIVLFSFFVLSRIPVINTILEFFGKISGSIFMFHTFIYLYYFSSFVYSFKYSILIYIIFCIICVVVAVVVEFLKKITFFNRLSEKVVLL